MSEKISIQARIAAERPKVWAYYTQPEHITQWNFASPDWHCPSAKNDLQVGGTYQSRMEAKDGSMGFDFIATYTAVDLGKSFTYVLEDGRQVEVVMNDHPNETVVSIVFDAESQNPVELQRQGWQAILDNFKKYAEQ